MSASLNDYMTTAQTQDMLARLMAYCQQTGSSERNVCNIAAVDHSIMRRMRCGALLTVGQHKKLKRMLKRFPDGVTANDKMSRSNKHDDIEKRLTDLEQRRLRHVEACRKAELERYGQNFGDWTPVERMIA